MADLRMLKNTQIIILGVCIVIATIVSSIIFSKGFLKVMQFTREMITVTGSAQKEIISDLVVWNGNFSRCEDDLATAYKNLKEDLDKIKSYLSSKGVGEREIIASQISAETKYFYTKLEELKIEMLARATENA